MKIKVKEQRILDGECYEAGKEYEVDDAVGEKLLATFPNVIAEVKPPKKREPSGQKAAKVAKATPATKKP